MARYSERADIDRGLTADKVTDAAGASPSLDEIRDARRREIARRQPIDDPAAHQGNRGFIVAGLLGAVAIVAAIAAVLGM